MTGSHSFPFLVIFLLISSCLKIGETTKSNNSISGPESPIPGASDPLSAFAWHLQNTGQSSFSSSAGVFGEDISIGQVHENGLLGQGIKIAISDSGVDTNHPDLSTNQLISLHRDYSQDASTHWGQGNPYPIEYEAHGTAVAGLVSSEASNGIGLRGIAPMAQFAAFLFIGQFHSSASSYEAKLLDQMTGDFDIFNYSYGFPGCEFIRSSTNVISAYKTGVTNLRAGKGAIYIKSAGNEFMSSLEDCYPGDSDFYFGTTNTSEDQNHPYLILTAAANANGEIASYSTPGSGLWITSLGGEYGTTAPALLTTDIQGCTHGFSNSLSTITGFNQGTDSLNSRCDYTSIMNGTSAAAPILSGVVALMLEKQPDLSWRDVKHILAKSADPIHFSTQAITHPGGVNWNLSGHVYDQVYTVNQAGNKFSNTYGFGRINAKGAIDLTENYTFPLGDYRETLFYSSSPEKSIPDKSATGVSDMITVSENYSIESVQIKVTTNHTYMGDLAIELTSPSQTTSRILLVNSNLKDSGLIDFTFISNAFYEERSQGQWKIKVVDGSVNDTGTLQNWKIKINGHL